jgi:dolichyl-phosphate-mannose-protein mannosyltransferase
VIVALVLLLRLPFLHQAIQGDDLYYLIGAEHGLIDPLHPTHARFLFLGEMVDMRGFSHPPLNAWILTGLLAAAGDVREVPFHFAYILFSALAALSMWSLARRFCERPFLATLLFLSVPAFVVNGGSLESDLPFLAFWMMTVALFVKAVDETSRAALYGSAIAGALAGLAAYQAVFLVPILALYVWQKTPRWYEAWVVTLAAPLALGTWQLFELVTSGPVPAAVLAGYLGTRGFQSVAQKTRNVVALVVHAGWIIPPLLVLAGFVRGSKWRWIPAALAAAAGAFYDPNPLFWASLGCGVLVLSACVGRDFLGAWVLLFFAGALAVFFAGSARYLLPVAAPVAILAARRCGTATLVMGFALQMALSFGLAVVNYQHWGAYRQFAASLSKEASGHRVWINGDWGLRFYLESEGALALPLGQVLQSGEIVVSSVLANPLPVNVPMASFAQMEIRPWIPLRTVSLDGRSAYSSATSRGLLPFEISTSPIDRVSASAVIEHKPQLSYLDPHDPAAASQILSGLFPDGWMTEQATVVLKRPARAADLRAVIYIPDSSPARRVTMLVDGLRVAEVTYAAPGSYSLDVPMAAGPERTTVTLTVDKTFSVPGDQRRLGAIVSGIGFR